MAGMRLPGGHALQQQTICEPHWLAQQNLLARKLGCFVELSPADRSALVDLWRGQRHHAAAGQDIAREGDVAGSISLLVSGWACGYKLLPDGRRQITAFYLPGDVLAPGTMIVERLDQSLSALTPVRHVTLSFAELAQIRRQQPNVGKAMLWAGVVDAAIQRERIVSLGKRSALERVAHLFCELYVRLSKVGLAASGRCELPITQGDLADALGLSSVHVNRTLRELRERELLVLQDRQLQLPDFAALGAIGMFDPAYLHLDHVREAQGFENA